MAYVRIIMQTGKGVVLRKRIIYDNPNAKLSCTGNQLSLDASGDGIVHSKAKIKGLEVARNTSIKTLTLDKLLVAPSLSLSQS